MARRGLTAEGIGVDGGTSTPAAAVALLEADLDGARLLVWEDTRLDGADEEGVSASTSPRSSASASSEAALSAASARSSASASVSAVSSSAAGRTSTSTPDREASNAIMGTIVGG